MTEEGKEGPGGSGELLSNYTCKEYREEMILLGLRKKLLQESLTEENRRQLEEEIERLEKAIGF